MATIIQETFNALPKHGLRLTQEEYVRPLGFGSNWTKLRIGVLLAIVDTGGTLTTVNFAVGVCSGTAGFGSASTTHAVVLAFDTPPGSNYTYNAGSGYPYYAQGVGNKFVRRVGSTNTVVNGQAGQPCFYSLGGTLRAGPVIVEMAKLGGGVVGCYAYSATAASSYNHYDLQSLMEIMEQPYGQTANVTVTRLDTSARVQGGPTGGATTDLTTVDESAGVLDHVNISWNHSNGLEIYAIAVSRPGWV